MAHLNHDTNPLWEGWQRREFRLAHCQDCGTWIHSPRRLCPECWSERIEFDVAEGTGRVVSWSLPRGAADQPAVISALIALDGAGGIPFLAQIAGCEPSDVQFDMAVTLDWREDRGATVPQFRPADGGVGVSSVPRAAIVSIGYSEFSRDSGVGPGTLVARAAKQAVLDSGVPKAAIDGVVGVYGTDLPTVWPGFVVEALGLPNVRWWDTSQPPSVNVLAQAAQAVQTGNCDYAICYHGKYRWASTSVAGRGDPLRQPPAHEFDPSLDHALSQHAGSMLWAARVMRWHMHHFGSTREDYGKIAVNNRTHAVANPRAVFRTPLTLDGYSASAMVDEPMCLLDMDAPVDGAMAVVVTTEERARDLTRRPVFIEALAAGLPYHNDGLLHIEADGVAARRTVEHLFAGTDLAPRDVDLSYPYDGFSILTMLWLEALYTDAGGGPELIRQSWSEADQQLRLFGRVPVCTHGGNLSEGRATQGFGHVLEAVQQLRGTAGERQVPGDPRTAVVTNGAAFSNRSALLSID